MFTLLRMQKEQHFILELLKILEEECTNIETN